MTTPTSIAKSHFAAAMSEAEKEGQGEDAVARAFLFLVLQAYQKTRGMDDIVQELQTAVENLDPDTDYMFMRP